MGAFGAHTSVNMNHAFNTSSGSSGAADDSDKTRAYAGAFFKKGGIDQVLAGATTSAKPLKITGQVIDNFGGDITHWPLFREQFTKLAHRPGNFSDDIERFYFLLSQLDGEAKKWVSDTPPVKGYYQHAADQLEKKYGNERELYKQLLHKFNQIKPLQPGCSAHQIVEFVKVATNCMAGIAGLGKADTTGRSLEELEEKLPPDLRREVFRRRSRDRLWDITKLEAYFLEEVDILKATYGDKGHSSGADVTKTITAVAFTPRNNGPGRSNTRPTKTSETPMCVFCSSRDHWGYNCTKFATISDRIKRIIELRKCYFCLNDHLADVCYNPRPVFNGSDKPDKTSPSMNDMLHKGPVLLSPITAVLLNSRLAPYVLSSDIAKAFLQVALRPDEKRSAASYGPSPALLAVVIEKHMQTVDTPLSREILANCYVDNIYLTTDDLEEAQDKYKESKKMFAD